MAMPRATQGELIDVRRAVLAKGALRALASVPAPLHRCVSGIQEMVANRFHNPAGVSAGCRWNAFLAA